jgi:hypothetical protein
VVASFPAATAGETAGRPPLLFRPKCGLEPKEDIVKGEDLVANIGN